MLVSDTFEDVNYVTYREANSLSPDHCPIELSIKMCHNTHTPIDINTQLTKQIEKINISGHYNNNDVTLFCDKLNKINNKYFHKKEGKEVDINSVEDIMNEICKAGTAAFGIKTIRTNKNTGIFENKEWKDFYIRFKRVITITYPF